MYMSQKHHLGGVRSVPLPHGNRQHAPPRPTPATPQHAHPGPMALPKSNQQPDPKPLPHLRPLQKTAEQKNMMRLRHEDPFLPRQQRFLFNAPIVKRKHGRAFRREGKGSFSSLSLFFSKSPLQMIIRGLAASLIPFRPLVCVSYICFLNSPVFALVSPALLNS